MDNSACVVPLPPPPSLATWCLAALSHRRPMVQENRAQNIVVFTVDLFSFLMS